MMNSINSESLDSVDRISDLPDSILTHILSFLPIKDVVATRILSQRWICVWRTTFNLDFCFPDKYREDQIVKIVSYVMLLHNPAYLNRFSLELKPKSYSNSVCAWINTWICTAVAKNVHELLVSVKNIKLPFQVQRSMFSCQGLRSLELNCNIRISSKIVVSLPKLQSLKLISVFFRSEKALCNLLGGCPVLKYLFIDINNNWKTTKRFSTDMVDGIAFKCIISSPTLSHLEFYARFESKAITSLCGIQLDTPSLEYIKLEDQIGHIFIQQSLTSLVEANIQLASLEPQYEVQSFDSVVNASRALDRARTLTLSDHVIRAFSCATSEMNTEFNLLKRLEVMIAWKHWSSLQDFIKFSHNLEILIIKKVNDKSEDHLDSSNWKIPVPRCLSNNLKIVSIDGCDGHPNELAMVDYILKHGSALQVMQICFDESISDIKPKFEMVKKISKLPKKSLVCKVEFC